MAAGLVSSAIFSTHLSRCLFRLRGWPSVGRFVACGFTVSAHPLIEADSPRSRLTMHVYSVNKADTVRARGHDQGMGPVSFAEETHASQKSSISDSTSGENDMT